MSETLSPKDAKARDQIIDQHVDDLQGDARKLERRHLEAAYSDFVAEKHNSLALALMVPFAFFALQMLLHKAPLDRLTQSEIDLVAFFGAYAIVAGLATALSFPFREHARQRLGTLAVSRKMDRAVTTAADAQVRTGAPRPRMTMPNRVSTR